MWGWVCGVECRHEVCQDTNLVAEQIMTFLRHQSRKGGQNKEGTCSVQGALVWSEKAGQRVGNPGRLSSTAVREQWNNL